MQRRFDAAPARAAAPRRPIRCCVDFAMRYDIFDDYFATPAAAADARRASARRYLQRAAAAIDCRYADFIQSSLGHHHVTRHHRSRHQFTTV